MIILSPETQLSHQESIKEQLRGIYKEVAEIRKDYEKEILFLNHYLSKKLQGGENLKSFISDLTELEVENRNKHNHRIVESILKAAREVRDQLKQPHLEKAKLNLETGQDRQGGISALLINGDEFGEIGKITEDDVKKTKHAVSSYRKFLEQIRAVIASGQEE